MSNKEINFTSKIEITEKILHEIGSLADKEGIEIYTVGGYVRDHFLNRERKDFDFTVIGDSINFSSIVAEHYHSKSVVFERFRTAMVPVGDVQLEFVGTRKEYYKANSRKPIVEEGTLYDDIARRDFTINTLAVSLNKNSFGQLIDLFNGIADLDLKMLKTPLDPDITFSDDPLRMMRAARFASQLDFSIEPETFTAISRNNHRIEIISMERISDEFIKILKSPYPSKGIAILYKTGLLKFIFPELNNLSGVEIKQEGNQEFAHKDVFRHTLRVLENICKLTDNTWLRFAALVHDIAKPKTKRFTEGIGWSFHGHEELGARWMDKIFRRMKFPLEYLPYVQKLVRLHQRPMMLVDEGITDSAIRRLAFQAGEALEDLFTLCRADITTKNPGLSAKYFDNYERVTRKVIEIQEKDKLREFQSPVRGEEIMEICGIGPSPAIGYIKLAIEEAILDGIIPNDYEASKAYFLQNRDKWIKEAVNYKSHKRRL